MASFFRPQHYYNVPEPNFQGLFRLIDDFDRYSGQSSTAGGSSKARPSFFTPKFDMTESEAAYELHGELPGISKDDVHMEFTDPQTLQIRGRVERTRTEGNPPAGILENSKSTDNNTKAIAEQAAADDHAETASNHSHHATVEDDPEESSSGAAASSSFSSTPQDTPATTVAETVKPSAPARQQQQQQQERPAGHKYYLVERNVGSFSRSFNFPSRVDNEAVRASLDNGILSVTVPKAPKHQTGRRIAIN